MTRTVDRRSMRARYSVEVLLWALLQPAPPTHMQLRSRWGIRRATAYRWAAKLAEVHAYARARLQDGLGGHPQ